jgi:hypothetical protein
VTDETVLAALPAGRAEPLISTAVAAGEVTAGIAS